MVCQGLEVMGTGLTWADFLVYPVTCFHYFWGVIFLGIFLIITFLIYNVEKEKFVQPDLISGMAVTATAILFLGVIGTLIKSTTGDIPMVSRDILIYIIGLWIPLVALWFFKR